MFEPILAEHLDGIAGRQGTFFAGSILQTIDLLLATAGVVLVIVWGLQRLRRRGAGSLSDAPERANRFGDDSVLLAVGVYFLAAVGLGALAGVDQAGSASVWGPFLAANGANLVGVGVCAGIVSSQFDGGIGRLLMGIGEARARAVGLSIGAAVASIGLCPLVALGVVVAVRLVAPGFEFPPHPTLLTLRSGEASPALVVGLWVGAVVIAPLTEELFFRGIVQTHLSRVLNGRWPAIAVTSLAFGVVHSGQPHAMLPLVLFAGVLGYVYERSGALMFPLLIHSAFNAKAMLWETLGAGGSL